MLREFTCSKCGVSFTHNVRTKHPKRCTSCREKRRPAGVERRREQSRGYQYKHKYGITIDEANAYLAQGCGICGRTDDLCIDHCHNTGYVRGALCRKCNAAIGLLNDDPALLTNAVRWVSTNNGGTQ